MKDFILEIEYIFLNNFLAYFPFWPIRKLFYKLLGMKIGKGSRIMMKTVVYCPHKIVIGDNSMINECCYLDGRGKIEIGNNVTIATFTKLISASHNIDDDDFSYVSNSIIIGDNSAVFSDSVVLGGAKISKGCVFSAKSLVRKGEYCDNGIYGGNPAVFIRKRHSKSDYKQQVSKLLFR